MVDTYKIAVCTCCLIMAANGEPCYCDYVENEVFQAMHPEDLMGKITDGHAVSVSDEEYFSHSSCDGCGSTYGGSRHDMVVFTH